LRRFPIACTGRVAETGAIVLIIAFAKGIVIGIVIALPVGPVGMLCVRRTLFEGVSYGLASGVGAASADAIFGIIAGLGLSVLRDWIVSWEDWLGAAGGIYLLYAGLRALAARPAGDPEPLAGERLFGAFASAFLLTITNPVTVLSFAAIFAKVGIDPAASYGGIAVLVAGIFTGSALWWLGLALGIAPVRRHAGVTVLRWVNRVSGAILVLSGLGLLAAAALGLAGVRV
jgi:threonine/homoserine/homoserine lactone efflux protein